jgi:hypothetical protein
MWKAIRGIGCGFLENAVGSVATMMGMRGDASRLWSMLGESMFAPSILQPVKAVENRSTPCFFYMCKIM